MKINVTGSVRVDLLGGTLDLNPINLILPNVKTLNAATSLKANVEIEKANSGELVIESLDYNSKEVIKSSELNWESLNAGEFGPLNFILQILLEQSISGGYKITLSSGSPAGAGLGGSSSMGVTLYKAIKQLKSEVLDRELAIKTVNSLEAKVLDKGPAGYQDYYPALYGGLLSLNADVKGVQVEQLYSGELKDHLEENFILIFSGETRLSGINNWEVYKSFFDNNMNVRNGLGRINEFTNQAYHLIKTGKIDEFDSLVIKEGEQRELLFPNILTEKMREFKNELKKMNTSYGLKVCGAGGGGCFLTKCTHHKLQVRELASTMGMSILDFQIDSPLEYTKTV